MHLALPYPAACPGQCTPTPPTCPHLVVAPGHAAHQLLEEVPRLRLRELPQVLDHFKQLAASRILHGNAEMGWREEDLPEADEVGVPRQLSVVDELSLHVSVDL